MIKNYNDNKKELFFYELIKKNVNKILERKKMLSHKVTQFKKVLDQPKLSEYKYIMFSLDAIERRLLSKCFINFDIVNSYIDEYNMQVLKKLS